MSKENFFKAASRELQSLNRAIDQKIIQGMSYSREARRHRFLTAELSRVRRQNLFGRFSQYVSLLLF